MSSNNPYIGSTLQFPINIVNGSGAIVSGVKALNSNLYHLLSIQLGESFLLQQYGSRIKALLFRPLTVPTLKLLESFVIDAIKVWVKNVILTEVKASIVSDNQAAILIRYKSTTTLIEGTFIYPFYNNLEVG